MDILVFIGFLFCFAIFAFFMAAKSFSNPTFAGHLMIDGRVSDKLYFLEFKGDDLVLSDALSKKVCYSFNFKEIFIEIKRECKPDELTEKDKSVIGRAVVGGILLAPLGLTAAGAIVGGISGIGSKQKIKKGEINTYVHLKSFDDEFLFKPALGHESTASLLMDKYRRLKH